MGELWLKSNIMNRILLILFTFFTFTTYAQDDSPYEVSWAVDGPWVGAGLGLNAVGLYLVQNKNGLTTEELANLSRDDVFFADRWIAGNHSAGADNLSYYPFYGSFAAPFVMMLGDATQRSHAGQISVMLIETMSLTGALFTFSAGLIDRPRPLVYNENLPIEQRIEDGAQRSFFAGHTAATAAASFFTAKVWSDFHPDSPATPFVWAAAAAVPAWVGYLRHKAGKHFLTDNLIGYGVGALSGIIVPELHKKENGHFSLYPITGGEYQGFALLYRF